MYTPAATNTPAAANIKVKNEIICISHDWKNASNNLQNKISLMKKILDARLFLIPGILDFPSLFHDDLIARSTHYLHSYVVLHKGEVVEELDGLFRVPLLGLSHLLHHSHTGTVCLHNFIHQNLLRIIYAFVQGVKKLID